MTNLLAVAALFCATLLLSPVLIVAGLANAYAGSVRWLIRRLEGRPQVTGWRELVQFEPEVGWRPRPDLDVRVLADDVYHLTTGPDGWRGRLTIDDADMVVFGDSFAFGHGADDDAMFTRYCGDLRVKPVGSDGYQMVHGLLWMRRLAASLTGKLVVWFIYYGNDLHENLMPSTNKYRMPHVRRSLDGSGWEIVTGHVTPEPWLFPHPASYAEFMASYSSATAFSDRVFSACDYLIADARRVCDEANATLAVVGVPDRSQLSPEGIRRLAKLSPDPDSFCVDAPDRKIGEICQAHGVDFVALRHHLGHHHYLAADIHWNQSGHRVVGGVLRNLYQNNAARQWPARRAVDPRDHRPGFAGRQVGAPLTPGS